MAKSKCPACRAWIDAEARRCAHCRHDLTPAEQAAARDMALTEMGIKVALVVLGAGALAWCSSGTAPAPSAPVDTLRPPPLQASADREKCARFISTATKSGLIRGRPSAIRVDVDEVAWVTSEAKVKQGLLEAIACDNWGNLTPPSGQYVVAYGIRNGRRLAMLTEVGMAFD